VSLAGTLRVTPTLEEEFSALVDICYGGRGLPLQRYSDWEPDPHTHFGELDVDLSDELSSSTDDSA